MTNSLNKDTVWASLPPEWLHDPLPFIQKARQSTDRTVVVLDDDPTGTQTVYDVPVLTEWSVESLKSELSNKDVRVFYVLTNSRSMTLPDAQALNVEIGTNLIQAAQECGADFTLISRSDSTLRGHFPGELDALETLGQTYDGWLIIPFFEEGGRFTINDVHYVAEGDQLIPAGETPFAQDKAFGYRASDMRAWVEEKTEGRIAQSNVETISLSDIREGGPTRVSERLLALPQRAVCAVNAASYRDVEVFVQGLLTAESQGKRYLYRTAASFVRVLAGLSQQELLSNAQLIPESTNNGGLIVVGSYVPKTTAQMSMLIKTGLVYTLEADVQKLLDDAHESAEIERIVRSADSALASRQDVMIVTSRNLVTGDNATSSLAIGRRISDSLIQIVRGIQTRPRYLLAKGGITSSDIATKGLGIQRATVLGQILPGIPVWRAGHNSRYPDLSYIVFPGNVGGDDSLVEAVERLEGRQ